MTVSFSMIAGDDRTLELTIVDDAGAAVDVTGAVITWRAGVAPYQTATLEKVGSISDAPNGLFEVDLVPADTAALNGTFYHWAVMTLDSLVSTIFFGFFTVSPTTLTASLEMFRARFPEFDALSDGMIQIVINEVSPLIDTSWVERDRPYAVIYLAAHKLAAEGRLNAGSGSGAAGWVQGAIKRRKVGDVEVEYGGSASGNRPVGGVSDGLDEYRTTPYGLQYITYLKGNFSGMAVI